jgi:hypothetical protein
MQQAVNRSVFTLLDVQSFKPFWAKRPERTVHAKARLLSKMGRTRDDGLSLSSPGFANPTATELGPKTPLLS